MLRGYLTCCAMVVMIAGCPGAEVVREPSLEPDASRALELYHDALVAGRTDAAFQLIHPDAREGLDARAFAALYERHKDALVAQAERLLAAARAGRPKERAEVMTERGIVVLERTDDGWRLVAPVGAKTNAPPAPGGPP